MTFTYQVVVVLTSRATAGSKYLVVLHKKSKNRYYSGNNRAKVLPFDSFDLYDKLIGKIRVRSHGNFFICFADFPAPWIVSKSLQIVKKLNDIFRQIKEFLQIVENLNGFFS